MNIDGLSLDQLRVFASVVEHGSFSAAARRLGRAQSAVTYAIQTLEGQLGVVLFDRGGYRPALSEAGRALSPRIARILRESQTLRAEARGIAGGLEAEIAMVVDAMFPMSRLVPVLRDFQQMFPSVATRLFVETLGAATAIVLDGVVDFGVLSGVAIPGDGLARTALMEVELVIVAAPGHALAGQPSPLSPDAVRDHVHLVLSDRARATSGSDHGVLATRTWRLADLGAKHAMLLAGLGWGSMPRHMVSLDLEAGRLRELRLTEWDGADRLPRLPIELVRRRDRAPGPAGRWLIERLSGQG